MCFLHFHIIIVSIVYSHSRCTISCQLLLEESERSGDAQRYMEADHEPVPVNIQLVNVKSIRFRVFGHVLACFFHPFLCLIELHFLTPG